MKQRYHTSIPGLLYLGLIGLTAFTAVNNQNNVLFWILGLLLSGLIVSSIVSGMMIRSIRIRRLLPAHGIVGEPMIVRYEVTNRSRFLPIFNIHIKERNVNEPSGFNNMMDPISAWVMHVGPNETVHGEAILWPRRRGKAAFGSIRIWTTFPLGVFRKSIKIPLPQQALVYPQLYQLKPGVLEAVTPQGLLGATVSRHMGSGDDYYGMREFRHGDSMRQVAWKRSAAMDQLVCIERTTPAPPKVRVVVNLTTPTDQLNAQSDERHSRRELEEAAISLAASIIYAADLNGFEIGLKLPGTKLPSILVRRNVWHRAKMLSALASIDLKQQRTKFSATSQIESEQIAQIIIHPDRVVTSIGGSMAWHLSARQLDTLTMRTIGWDAAQLTAHDSVTKPNYKKDTIKSEVPA